jgi:hypothetical protein
MELERNLLIESPGILLTDITGLHLLIVILKQVAVNLVG